MATQIAFGFAPRPKLRLAEIEDIITKHRIIVPCPSRQTLINWIEEGYMEGRLIGTLGWIVYEDSFIRWVKSLEEDAIAA